MSPFPDNPSMASRKAARVAGLYLVFASLWIFASDHLLTLALDDPEMLVRIGMAKGFAFVAVTTLLLYLVLRLWDDPRAENGDRPARKPRLGKLAGIFAGLVLLVPLIAFSIVRLHGPHMRDEAFAGLRTIAALKAGQIENWLNERQNDAEIMAGDNGLAMHAKRLAESGDGASREYAANRLRSLTKAWDADSTMLLNGSGQVLISAAKPSATPSPSRQRLLAEALDSGRIQRSELYRDASGRIHLDYAVPLPGNGGNARPAAVALLHAPVERFLFPLIQSWPTPSPSAETLLVRRDGDHVLFLNELRHRRDTALSLRLPLDTPNIPAVAAVHSGKARELEGVDYRGTPVLAVTRPVAGTPWHLVAKIDRAEVLAPLDLLIFWVSLVGFVAVTAIATAMLLLWRQTLRAHRLELLAQSSEKDRRLNAELEKKVAERTAQLKAINNELETFTYSVSHDLKAPLRGIDGYSRLLQEEHAASLSEEGQAFLANIRKGAQQMNQLIEDLLAYSRLERRALQTVRIAPEKVAEAVVAEFADEIHAHRAMMGVAIPCLEVRADTDGLAMILRNLLGNALKFSRDAPQPAIEIGGREETESCILWVRDNGIGFDMRFHERIFEIFQRLQRAEDYPGTGIGLAIVRKAAQRMGGRAWAESAPGQGAIFYVELPK